MRAVSDMIPRRHVLKTAAASGLWLLTSGHAPYKQRDVYRRRPLLIGAHKADLLTYELGKKIAALLLQELPASKARVVHTSQARRLARLITSNQIQLILLDRHDLGGLRYGRSGFEAFGPTDLRGLYRLGDYWLVSTPDFPDQHAKLVVQTLTQHGAGIAKWQGLPGDQAPVPMHAALYAEH